MNLFVYNKQLQKMIDVDIEVYKKISGKYKIGEKMEKERNIC